MTHEELANYAMKVGISKNEVLWSAGYDLLKAVENEKDSEDLAERVMEIAGW